jgi:hypothetical protein
MHIIRRLFALVLGLVSIAVFLACIGGTVGLWVVQKPLLEKTTLSFGKANEALDVASTTLNVVEKRLKIARQDLTTIKETAGKPKAGANPPSILDQMASRALVAQLGPNVQQVSDSVEMASDAAIVLNSLLDGLNQLPETKINSLDTERLTEIHRSLKDVTKTSQELSALLADGSPSGSVDEKTTQMDDLLKRVLDWVGDFRTKVAQVQSDVTALKPRLHAWIHLGAVIGTVVLLWMAASQLCVLGYACSWFKGKAAPPAAS